MMMDRRLEIERLAYEFFEKSGGGHGDALAHWFEAERIVNLKYNGAATISEKMLDAGQAADKKSATAKITSAAEKKPARKKPGTAGKGPSKTTKPRVSKKENS